MILRRRFPTESSALPSKLGSGEVFFASDSSAKSRLHRASAAGAHTFRRNLQVLLFTRILQVPLPTRGTVHPTHSRLACDVSSRPSAHRQRQFRRAADTRGTGR